MPDKRPRQLASVLLVTVALLALAACGTKYPNSTFDNTTDFNTDVNKLWDRLLLLGTIVFVFVESLLVYTIIRYRKREGAPMPKAVHGHAGLEITWTIIPALILAMIAVPTVQTIFKTEAPAPSGALEVQVIGHQWWWEFRYPQYGVTTANELYLPAGRTANFSLQSRDVIHSFWTPELGGKRDLITNHTNHIWYTPIASLADTVFNGFCTEYCGSSHANMRLRTYVVAPDKFESWAAHQKASAAMSPVPADSAATAAAASGKKPVVAAASIAGALTAAAPAAAAGAPSDGWFFPAAKLPEYAKPKTPLPEAIKFEDALLAQGDAAAGHDLVTNFAKNMTKAPCATCHIIRGETPGGLKLSDDQATAPNLTHFATRHTFAGGIYAADPRALARWIKNAPAMKPGSIMPTLGLGEYNAMVKKANATGLSDKEIADIVAYLLSLK
ncbi:MAG: cytochrome c oxidase subunit II [Gemmatimonadales bacterium]